MIKLTLQKSCDILHIGIVLELFITVAHLNIACASSVPACPSQTWAGCCALCKVQVIWTFPPPLPLLFTLISCFFFNLSRNASSMIIRLETQSTVGNGAKRQAIFNNAATLQQRNLYSSYVQCPCDKRLRERL